MTAIFFGMIAVLVAMYWGHAYWQRRNSKPDHSKKSYSKNLQRRMREKTKHLAKTRKKV